jgi:hypothetical protein
MSLCVLCAWPPSSRQQSHPLSNCKIVWSVVVSCSNIAVFRKYLPIHAFTSFSRFVIERCVGGRDSGTEGATGAEQGKSVLAIYLCAVSMASTNLPRRIIKVCSLSPVVLRLSLVVSSVNMATQTSVLVFCFFFFFPFFSGDYDLFGVFDLSVLVSSRWCIV